jgi:hypothetical protein
MRCGFIKLVTAQMNMDIGTQVSPVSLAQKQ